MDIDWEEQPIVQEDLIRQAKHIMNIDSPEFAEFVLKNEVDSDELTYADVEFLAL
jgi:hypothetical protein